VSTGDDYRPIGLILDTTAILAFAAGSMDVHEPIIVADEAGEDVGVPLACLLEAVRRDPAADLHELLNHPKIVILHDRDDDLLTDWTIYYDGREDCAAAAAASYRHGYSCMLTAEPDTYAIGGKRPRWVVPIDGSW
jgi:hypothetical protein